jgi:hypothetical protein
MKKIYRDALIAMNIVPTKKNLESLSPKDIYKFNELTQKEKGDEEFDYFTINEPFGSTEKVFEFANIKDFDFDDWKFQKENQTTVSEKYENLYLPGHWFRALELNDFGKRRLTYGQLESANSFCLIQVIEKLEKKLDKKIPFIFAREYGVGMFSPIEGSEYCSMNPSEKRCGGKELEREVLEKRIRELQPDIEKDILLALKDYEGYTFRRVSDKPLYDHLDMFLIGGFEAAEKISFKTFFKDFNRLEQPFELLKKTIKLIYKKYKKEIFE